ncbi:hypothetical protein O988_00844 [Pseudogymnoascus sp. VKM F-3808]|nr:hypothetical protein O988_00844 [Pseudogymnoascus sp. VKM F-3808]
MTVLHSESLVGQHPVLIREQDPVYFVEYKGIVRSTEEGIDPTSLTFTADINAAAMSRNPPNPTNWDDYQYGTSYRSSGSSTGRRSVRFDADSERELSPSDAGDRTGLDTGLRRRRSSINMHLNAIGEFGGVNSINNFARSWQRAAAFHEVTPQRPSFVLATDNEEQRFSRSDIEPRTDARASLLQQHFLHRGSDEAILDSEDAESVSPLLQGNDEARKSLRGSEFGSIQGSSPRGRDSVFGNAAHLATPLGGSYGTSYGTIRSTVNESSMAHAGRLWRQQQETGDSLPDGERPPLLVKEVEQDGKIVLVIDGQSTLPQTVFNSTNVLIGVGILSLPLGIKYAGWLCGTIFLAAAALVTGYTAKLLAKCMDVDASLITFADLAFISFGHRARIATGILFSIELLAACVALIVLFAETLDLLIPGVGVVEWKIICGFLMIPLNFVPLRLLSFSSILGIFSCFCIVSIIFIDGFIKPETPGSLREPAETFMFPKNWLTLPISLGLLISPFGGHAIFPSIYRDMRHPHRYGTALKVTFSFTYLLDALTATAGYLMYGDGVLDSVTNNIIRTSGYPQSLTVLLCVFIAIIPLTKLPLNARPIVATLEALTGLDVRTVPDEDALVGCSKFGRGVQKIAIRVIVIVSFVFLAIVFPAFDSIMAFMGSCLCFMICVILPLLFHLRIFGNEIPRAERILNWVLIVICSILAVIGTVFAFLPKSWIGAE